MNTCSHCNAVLTDGQCLACALVEMPTPAVLEASLPNLKVIELIGGDATTGIFQVEERPYRRRACLIVIGGIQGKDAFQEKVRPWVCLDHPYIQSIYRIESVSGWACLLATPLSGSLLDDALEEESWTGSRAERTFLAICQTIRHIHQQNFAHGRLDRESIYARPDHHVIVTLVGIHDAQEATVSTLQAKDFRTLCQLGRTLAERTQMNDRAIKLLTESQIPVDTVSAIQEIESSWQSKPPRTKKGLRSLFGQ